MTRITDEAVEAAARQFHPTLWDGQPGNRHAESARADARERVRLVLEAALPHLEGATPIANRDHMIRVLVDLLQEANKRDIAALARQGYPGIPEVPDYDMQVHCGHLVDALIKAGVFREGATSAIDSRGVYEAAASLQTAEDIATVIEEYADDLEPPTTSEWLEQRSWFKGLLHEVAARAREIGGAS